MLLRQGGRNKMHAARLKKDAVLKAALVGAAILAALLVAPATLLAMEKPAEAAKRGWARKVAPLSAGVGLLTRI
jgi:hypothetical protein